MKEASNIELVSSKLSFENIQQKCSTISSETLIKVRRRGYIPTVQQQDPTQQHMNSIRYPQLKESSRQLSTQHPSMYPYSALGQVQLKTDSSIQYGMGTIIGKNIILTAASNCISPNSQNSTITFISSKGIRFQVKRIHPSNLMEAKKEMDRLPLQIDFGVLQLMGNIDLELQYGSLGYDFGEDPVRKQLYILTVSSLFQLEHVVAIPLNQSSPIYSYNCNIPVNKGLKGSPILMIDDNEFIIRGLHCQFPSSQQRNYEMCLFNKQMQDSLDKLTLRGKILELINEHLRTNQIHFLTQVSLTKLVQVNLQKNFVDDEAAKYISRASWTQMRSVILSFNRLKDEAAEYLSQSPWRNLQNLVIDHNEIGWMGMKQLSMASWPNLTNCDLKYNRIGDKGLAFLIKADWKILQEIHLDSTEMGDMGCEKLRKTAWPHLTKFSATKNPIGEVGLRHLTKCNWKKLKEMELFIRGQNSLFVHSTSLQSIKKLLLSDWKHLRILQINKQAFTLNARWMNHSLREKYSKILIL